MGAKDSETDDAFTVKLLKLERTLRTYARSLKGLDPDDLFQEAVTRAFAARRRFVPGSNMRAWVMTIMRNYYLSQIRRKGVGTTVSLDDEENLALMPSILGNQEKHIELLEVEKALAALPQTMRTSLQLVAIQGFEYEEAAEIDSVALGTMKSRVARARLRLAVELDRI